MSVHYFLCRQGDSFYRIGIQSSSCKIAEEYLAQYYDNVTFIDDFVDVIYSDVDKDTGVGARKFPGGVILTCKYVFQLRTAGNNDYFEYLRRFHRGLKAVVEQEYRRRNKGAVA